MDAFNFISSLVTVVTKIAYVTDSARNVYQLYQKKDKTPHEKANLVAQTVFAAVQIADLAGDGGFIVDANLAAQMNLGASALNITRSATHVLANYNPKTADQDMLTLCSVTLSSCVNIYGAATVIEPNVVLGTVKTVMEKVLIPSAEMTKNIIMINNTTIPEKASEFIQDKIKRFQDWKHKKNIIPVEIQIEKDSKKIEVMSDDKVDTSQKNNDLVYGVSEISQHEFFCSYFHELYDTESLSVEFTSYEKRLNEIACLLQGNGKRSIKLKKEKREILDAIASKLDSETHLLFKTNARIITFKMRANCWLNLIHNLLVSSKENEQIKLLEIQTKIEMQLAQIKGLQLEKLNVDFADTSKPLGLDKLDQFYEFIIKEDLDQTEFLGLWNKKAKEQRAKKIEHFIINAEFEYEKDCKLMIDYKNLKTIPKAFADEDLSPIPRCAITKKNIRFIWVQNVAASSAKYDKESALDWIKNKPNVPPDGWPIDKLPLPIKMDYFKEDYEEQQRIDKTLASFAEFLTSEIK